MAKFNKKQYNKIQREILFRYIGDDFIRYVSVHGYKNTVKVLKKKIKKLKRLKPNK